MEQKRQYRREGHYTPQIGVRLKPETRQQADAIADRYGKSLSQVVRDATEAGLAKVADRYRKQRERDL